MELVCVGRSELGLVRLNNEDAWAATTHCAVVSDGVGGRPAGEVAAGLAVSVFSDLVAAGSEPPLAVHIASRAVQRVGRGNSLFSGMCATLTAVVLTPEDVQVVHVGDSSGWLVRDGKATPVTEPQTVTHALLAAGEITAEQALTHPGRGMKTQVVGGAKELKVATQRLDVRAGDRYVLATDGLDYVDATTRATLLAAPKPAEELADALVAAALEAGGEDNVTVVVVDLVDDTTF